jgi:hypothetical protein
MTGNFSRSSKEIEMKKKLTVHMAFVYLYVVAAVLSLVPVSFVSKPCRLGYMALCSFTPISTVILLAMAVLHVFLQKKADAKTA